MRPLLALVATVGVASAAAATTIAIGRDAAVDGRTQEQLRPGPDSARVATLLTTLGEVDAVFCELVSDQIGNFWWSDGDLGVGRFGDARTASRAAKDSVSGPVKDPGALRLLEATLATENSCVRHVAAKMLGNGAVTDEVLTRLLSDGSARVREAALRAAGERDRLGLRTRVERMVAAPEPAVAAMAAWVLGEYEQRTSVPVLRRALTHSAAPVRTAAAWALGNIEDPSVADDLERLVARDADRRVRLAAIRALGDLEQARSSPVLAQVLNGTDIPLSIAAAEALQNLDGLESAPEALIRATESGDRELRYAALEALVQFEDERLAPIFLRFITDPAPEMRVQMIEALGNLRVRSAVRAITRALDDENADVRRAAIEALAEIDDR